MSTAPTLLKSYSDSPPSITYSPNRRALTGWLSPRCMTSYSMSLCHTEPNALPYKPCLFSFISHAVLLARSLPHLEPPFLQTLHIYNTFCIFSGSNPMPSPYRSFSRSFYSKIISAFLNIPTNLSVLFCWY